MNSVRWRDWTRKATERSNETTQREVDETGGIRMWRAPERARSGVMSWVRRRRAEEEGACEFTREGRGRCTHSTAGEGTREHSRRRDTRAQQEKGQQHDAQTEHDKQKRKP